jgi:hypothetical protein
MPGLYDLLPRPTVACSSELGQLWRLPDALARLRRLLPP